MLRNRGMFVLPLLVLMALAVPQLGAAEIRDHAGMFSAEAVRKAQAEFDKRRTSVSVVIETITSIPGLERGASSTEKRRAIEVLAEKKAKEIGYEGVYLLISKEDQVFSELLVRERYASLLPRDRRRAVRDAFLGEFKNNRFDVGLVKGAGVLAESLSEAPVAGPRRAVPGLQAPRRGDVGKFGLGTLLAIGLGIFGVLILLRVLGGLFGRGAGYPAQTGMGGMGPGMGPGPGYGYGGPRGGGFFSGMLGGLGGALAGNWLYDQFSGRHAGAGHVDAGSYTPAEATETANPRDDAFVGGDDNGGMGTSWSDPSGDTGGDWGGGDGGGDWGGGDWGDGGDGGGW